VYFKFRVFAYTDTKFEAIFQCLERVSLLENFFLPWKTVKSFLHAGKNRRQPVSIYLRLSTPEISGGFTLKKTPNAPDFSGFDSGKSSDLRNGLFLRQNRKIPATS